MFESIVAFLQTPAVLAFIGVVCGFLLSFLRQWVKKTPNTMDDRALDAVELIRDSLKDKNLSVDEMLAIKRAIIAVFTADKEPKDK